MSVVLENVAKSYPTPEGPAADILRVARLDIPKGAQWVITGESGSGKTTLLNLIGGIVLPDRGSVSIDGTDITRLSEAARDRFRARRIGYVFQTFNLLSGFTALENVLLGMLFAGRVRREHAQALLERVGLKDRLHHRASRLSVGQQQRVAIARALANDPTLILADEPTGNVDPRTGDLIVGLLKEVCAEGGQTLLLVTHQPHVVAAFKDVRDIAALQDQPCRS